MAVQRSSLHDGIKDGPVVPLSSITNPDVHLPSFIAKPLFIP
jgi:hypothetical protein